MRDGVFNGLSLAGNPLVCDCGCQRFSDWLDELQPVTDSVTCVSPGGVTYDVKYDDLSAFCGDTVPNRYNFRFFVKEESVANFSLMVLMIRCL